MTDDQIKRWKETRDVARSITDAEDRARALQCVYDQRDDMMMKCIAHQSERSKKNETEVGELKSDVAEIKSQIKPMQETCSSVEEAKLKWDGAKIFWDVLKVVCGAGGGAFILKALGG